MSIKNPIEAFHSIPEPQNPKASPVGNWVACQWNPTGRFELHVTNRTSGEQRQLTDGEIPRDPTWWTYWWLNDSCLVFQDHSNPPGEDCAHTTGIHRVNLDGTVEHCFDVDGEVRLWGCNHDTDVIYYHVDGDGYWYDPATETRCSFESFQGWATGTCRPSPDGDRIAFTVHRAGDYPHSIAAYLAHPDGSDLQSLAPEDEPPFGIMDWHPDGDQLLVYRLPANDSEPHFGIYTLATGSVNWIADGRVTTLLDGGARILTEGRNPRLYTLDGDSTSVAGDGNLRVRSTWTVTTDDTGCVLQRRPAARRPAELIHYDIHTHDVDVLFAPAYDTVTPADFVTGEEVTFEGPDGEEVAGLLYRPPDGGTDPVPAVAKLYPRASFRETYRPEDHLLAHTGYAVFIPQCPAEAPTDAAHETFAAAGRWLARYEGIDEHQVACYGHSAGGYSVYMQAVRYPEVWDGFIADTGIVDLLALTEDDSGGRVYDQFRRPLGDPDENAAAYRAQSPMEHVSEDVGTPLLMLHGELDAVAEHPRVFGDALEAEGLIAGKEFKYVEFPDQEHSPNDQVMQIRRWQAIVAFLDQRL